MQAIKDFTTNSLNYIKYTLPVQAYELKTELQTRTMALVNKISDNIYPVNPVTHHRQIRLIPTSIEIGLGKIAYASLCPISQRETKTETANKVEEVFNNLKKQAICQDFPYEVSVIKDKHTINAFCVPGGKIAITTGLIEKLKEETTFKASEEEQSQLEDVTFEDKLAAVLGHEIGHACARHGATGLQLKIALSLLVKVTSVALGYFIHKKGNAKLDNKTATMPAAAVRAKRRQIDSRAGLIQSLVNLLGNFTTHLYTLKHSRCHEFEADKYGIKLAKKSGYNINGALWIQHKFLQMKNEVEGKEKSKLEKTLELFATHPASAERLVENRKTIQELHEEDELLAFCGEPTSVQH